MCTVTKIALAAEFTEEDLAAWHRMWIQSLMCEVPFAAFLRNPFQYLTPPS